MEMPSGDGNATGSHTCSTWSDVEDVINRLAAESPGLQQDTIENARLVVRFAAGRCEAPNDIGLGYWPTVRFIWSASSSPVEIEIFEAHYEFYSFDEGTTKITHIATIPRTLPTALSILLVATIPANPS